MTAFVVSAGQTSTGLFIGTNDTLTVSAGGTVVNTTVSGASTTGGSADILGLAISTTVSGGLFVTVSGGVASDTVIVGGGFDDVGSIDVSATISGGSQQVDNGGQATGATVMGSAGVIGTQN